MSIATLLCRSARRPAARLRSRAAFTLLEVLVALGAVALISLGLAKIFGATSQTLRAGRRISHFNDYARTLEVTMRRDFDRLTREGYLVIAHELTEMPVGISAKDQRQRQRRIDAIQFFAAGQFNTHRTPVYPSRVASGAQAVIYYGHGLRQDPAAGSVAKPALDDPNRGGPTSDSGAPVDVAPWFGEPGPNQYASDWILLRHVAVLVQPKAKAPPYPTGLLFPTQMQWEDNDIQVDMAPAQSSLFRNLARGTPGTIPATNLIARPHDTIAARPLLASGIPDLITTDLAEIRSIVLDAQKITSANPALEFKVDNDAVDDTPAGATVPIPYAYQRDTTPDGSKSCGMMKQWMLQGLPTEPRVQTSRNGLEAPMPQPPATPAVGGRIHCELVPPDYLGTVANGGSVYVGDEEYRRTDETMLCASNFAPACTEFIVEWSFGDTYKSDTHPETLGDQPDPFLGANDPRTDELIWHGLKRLSATSYLPGGGLDDRLDQVAGPYLSKVDSNPLPGQVGEAPIDALLEYSEGEKYYLPARVIHEPVQNDGTPDPRPGEPFYSIFGYVDPTFGKDATHPNRPDSIACPWPRLIRVTMTLADPADPTFEQTYQFVFKVRDDRRNGE